MSPEEAGEWGGGDDFSWKGLSLLPQTLCNIIDTQVESRSSWHGKTDFNKTEFSMPAAVYFVDDLLKGVPDSAIPLGGILILRIQLDKRRRTWAQGCPLQRSL